MEKGNNKVSLETMTGVGKKKTIAGREYTILPVNIRDMHLILGDENPEEKLIILDKKKVETSEDWQIFGLNITNEKRKKTFLYILNKYVFYSINGENVPMTEELLIDHNWSFKEIGEFLFVWAEISD